MKYAVPPIASRVPTSRRARAKGDYDGGDDESQGDDEQDHERDGRIQVAAAHARRPPGDGQGHDLGGAVERQLVEEEWPIVRGRRQVQAKASRIAFQLDEGRRADDAV